MGLSSSQARLLSLTGRMHQIEYKAQKLEAEKLQLANETRRVYEDYLNALEMIKIQNKILNTDGSVTFIDATYNNFIGKKISDSSVYILKDMETGKVYLPSNIRSAYEDSDKTIGGYLKTLNSLKSNDNLTYTSIKTAEDLMNLSNSTGNFRLDADITLDSWEGIDLFKGTLDGNGHTISINSGTNGLFKTAQNATLKNIELNVNIKSNENNIGGLVGQTMNCTVENCSVKGTLSGGRKLGGLIGAVFGTLSVNNCSTNVDITSTLVSDNRTQYDNLTYAGGFIGTTNRDSNVTIENCRSDGNVASEYQVIGGFIGITQGTSATITNCISTGNITADKNGRSEYIEYEVIHSQFQPSGTFLGEAHNSCNTTITNSYAYGVPTNLNSDNSSSYTDFGTSYGRSSITTNNCKSTFSGELPPNSTPPTVSISDISSEDYPNISAGDLNYYVQMFNVINESGGAMDFDKRLGDSSEWFSNIITNGFATIAVVDISQNSFKIYDTSVAIDTNLQEIQDNSRIRIAEAKYEADMRRIDMKDRKYDYDLAAIENERNAIKQEMETLKTVAKENVERTFKLFS